MKEGTDIGQQDYGRESICRITSGMEPDDVPHLLELASEAGIFTPDELVTAEELAWECAFQGPDGDTGIIQARISDDAGDRPVGFACYGAIPHWPGNYELYFIVVDEAYRHQGIGTALMDEVERRIALYGGRRIYVETGGDSAFEAARMFYEANLFTVESRFCKQFIPKQGSVAYRKVLSGDDFSETTSQ